MEHYDICIIGGGASGMAAAVAAADARPCLRIIILEKKEELGKKILASGNGRCNLTNEACPGAEQTKRFFARLGVLTLTEEGGRVYPRSEDAADVRDALRDAAAVRHVTVRTGCAVSGCTVTMSADCRAADGSAPEEGGAAGAPGGFLVRFQHDGREKKIASDQLILAAGGKAGPAFGTTGDGAVLARQLGHTVTRLAPALTAVITEEDVSPAAGVRQKAEVVLSERLPAQAAEDMQETVGRSAAPGRAPEGPQQGARDVPERELFRERGEIQFTRYGISGICVFNMTREMQIPEGKTLKDGFSDYVIRIDFLPETPDPGPLLRERAHVIEAAGQDPLAAGRLLRSIVRRPLAELILSRAAVRTDPVRAAAGELKQFVLHPAGLKGWDFAQVTMGGAVRAEIDPDTMASRLVPGLYFSGEVIDWDGPCGGFNLQHAWETGIRAGRSAAEAARGRITD